MISILQGAIYAKLTDALIVMVGGVGLRVLVTQPLLTTARPGDPILLHTHLVVREDDLTLIGFATDDELYDLAWPQFADHVVQVEAHDPQKMRDMIKRHHREVRARRTAGPADAGGPPY